MLADLDLALKNPLELVQQLFRGQDSSLDGFEERVASTFGALFEEAKAREQLPTLTSLSNGAVLPPPGSLVRFRAMVQDTGLGSELYRAAGSEGQLYMYGAEEQASGGADNQPEDYSKLRERQIFYVVSVPGETAWAKESLDETSVAGTLISSALLNEDAFADLQTSVERIALDGSKTSAVPTPLANKHPISSEPHFGIVAKVYGDVAEQLKSTDVCEFIGVLGETALNSDFDELSGVSTSQAPVPALHVILARPTASPSPLADSSDKTDLRAQLVEYIAASLGGDKTAAEWVLLALVARIHTRHATGMALGSLSLNLALPDAFSTAAFSSILDSLLPAVTSLDLSIATLNDAKTRLAPRSRDESLESGALQLPTGTAVLVDLLSFGEGKLEDTGVRNLRHLATCIAQQKLSYQFPFSSFELDTDLNFIVLSEGKAIVPTECVVYVEPTAGSSTAERPSTDVLDAFRSFISTMKAASFSIPESMSDVIQADFVERRQASQGGEGMTQDDLLFRMTAARLMALSHGENKLSKEAWMRTAELDDRRKDRLPVVPQQ